MAHRHSTAPPLPFWADPQWHPLLVALGGLALCLLALVLQPLESTPAVPGIRLLLIAAALLVGGAGIRLAFRLPMGDFAQQTFAAGPLFAGAATAFVAGGALPDDWRSVRMALWVASVAGLLGGLVVILPVAVRKVAASVLIVIHFAGIFVAITCVELPSAPAPWVSNMAWGHFYRPYLGFLYMNNAYHFYSPDPGPSNLLWVRIEYSDGSYRWIKLPNREEARVPMEFQRHLAMAESTNAIVNNSLHHPDYLAEKQRRRNIAGSTFRPEPIPVHPVYAMANQYAEPMPHAKEYIASYARHFLANAPPARNPEARPVKAKLYRVTHRLLDPAEMVGPGGRDPMDPTTYLPYYQGEYDTEGKLTKEGQNDGLLWWLIPIVEMPEQQDPAFRPAPGVLPKAMKIKDYVKIQAGDVVADEKAEGKKP